MTEYYLGFAAVLFSLGTLGVLVRRDTLIVLMCIELMLNAVNISFVAIAREFQQIDGHIYVFFVMTVAAAEAAVGLGILLGVFRNFVSTQKEGFYTLRG